MAQVADTLAPEESFNVIALPEVWVFAKDPSFASDEERKAYELLKRRVKYVYPYAKKAAEKLQEVEKVLDTLPSIRKKKRYTKAVQKDTEKRFSAELKKLSRSQGRILIKLIHRQTGKTAFALVKELRSGWRAFWYNNTAWLYDLSLKTPYDPYQNREDFLIEDVLQRAFSEGSLEEQAPAQPIDYGALLQKWNLTPKTKH